MATNKDVKPQNPAINRSHPLARGLVGAWPVSNTTVPASTSVAGQLLDVAGGSNGTITAGSSPVALVRSSMGLAIEPPSQLFSVNSLVNLGQPTWWDDVITKEGSWTLSTWAKTTQVDAILLSRQDGAGVYRGMQWMIGGGGAWPGGQMLQLWHDYSSNNSILNYTDTRWDDGEWHLHTAVYRGSTGTISGTGFMDLYVDGVAQPTSVYGPYSLTSSDVSSSVDVMIYSSRGGNVRFQHAAMDIRVYNRALTASECLTMFVSPWSIYEPARPIIKYFYAASAGTPHSPQSDIILLDGQSAISTTEPLAAEGLIVQEERLFRRQRPVAGDRLVLTGSTLVQSGKMVIASDGLSLREKFSLYVGPLHDVREQEGIEVSEEGVWGFLTDLNGDRVGLEETFTATILPPPVVRTGSDGLILADAATTDLTLSWIGAHDVIKLAENITIDLIAQGIYLTVSDGLKLSEPVVDPASVVMLWPDEKCNLIEQGTLQQGYSFGLDIIHLGETLYITPGNVISSSDGIALRETINISTSITKGESEVIQLKESGALINQGHFDIDGISLGETTSTQKTIVRYFEDGLKLSESLIDPEGIFAEEHADGMKLGETILKAFVLARTITDGLKISESLVDPSVTFVEEHAEGIKLGETLLRAFSLRVQDGLSLAENIIDPAVIFVEEHVDGMKLGETILKALSRTVNDGLRISESIVDPKVDWIEDHYDGLKLTESLLRAFTLFITDDITLVEKFTTLKTHVKIFTEGIVVNDQSYPLKTQHRNIVGGVKIGENISKNQLATGSTVRLQGTIEDLLILTATIR